MEPTPHIPATVSILYVEDERDTREILHAMLVMRYPEYRIFTAENGLQGLELFRELRSTIVITDLSMPGMDGISMAAEIKSIAPETIVIALTAHSGSSNLLQAIEIGINHFILKPLDYQRICCILDRAIATARQEQQLREQNDQIRTLNAALTARSEELEFLNAELDAFNYSVAHDLRSPLSSICGYVQVLLHSGEAGPDDQNRRCLQAIYTETGRMNCLLEALLKFSRTTRKNIEKQWTDFSGIAHEIALNLAQQEPRRRVAFAIADGVHGFGDPVLIRVVLENLMGNAWKYSAKNDAARIEFGETTRGDEIVYYVRDNGTGFDQQEAEGLFAPFQRLHGDEEFAGFGVGLATACRIVQRHGGRIWAEGEKERGATFFFSL
jgi:hypothetical protein